MSNRLQQIETDKANDEFKKAADQRAWTRADHERHAAEGEKRRAAVDAAPAGSYRSLRAVLNDGKDKAERR